MSDIGTLYRKQRGVSGRYDTVVIGSGMGGLTVASLLAQEGQRVLLLEQNTIVGGCTQSYARNGYRWNVGMHYIGDVHAPGTMTSRLFAAVTGNGIEWNPLPAIYNRMAIADRVYEIPAGAEPYAKALKDAFPAEAEAIDRYMELLRVVPRTSGAYFAQKALAPSVAEPVYDDLCGPFHEYSDRTTLDVLQELTQDRELIAVLCANWGDYSLPPHRSSFAMHCMLNKHYLAGASFPTGGGHAFARSIVPIIEGAGGAVLRAAAVAEILSGPTGVRGVRLESGEEIEAERVVSNAGVKNTFGRLLAPERAADHGLDRRVGEIDETYCAVGINVGLSRSAAELGIQPANIWAHPGPDLQANLDAHAADFDAPFPVTFLTFPSSKDPAWESEFPGKATVEMYGFTAYEHFAKWQGTSWHKRGDDYESRKAQVAERLFESLFRFVPKARDCVDTYEVSTPLSYETFLRRERGGFLGIDASPERFRARWLRAHTPIEGLYLTGQDVATDGVIGALAGGVIAASAILGRDLMSEIRSRPPAG